MQIFAVTISDFALAMSASSLLDDSKGTVR